MKFLVALLGIPLGLVPATVQGQWVQSLSAGTASYLRVSGHKIFAAPPAVSTDDGVSFSEITAFIYPSAITDTNPSLFAVGPTIFYSRDSNEIDVLRDSIMSNSDKVLVFCYAIIGRSILAGSQYFGMYRSTNFGATWQTVAMPGAGRIFSLAVRNHTVLAGTDSGIYRSSDSGSSWARVLKRRVATIVFGDSVAFGACGQCYDSVYYYSCVFRSSDDGKTWVQGGPTLYYTGFLAVSGNYLFSGYNDAAGLLMASEDEGDSWTVIPGPFHRAGAVAISGPNVVVGTDVTGTWYAPLSDVTSYLGVVIPRDHTSEVELRHNLTHGIIAVQSASIISRIAIENLLGGRVLEVANPRATEFTLDLSKLPAGVYFARFEMEGGAVEMRKIVKE